MLDVNRALESPSVLRALTGLEPGEFRALLPLFTQLWEEHTRFNWRGHPRQRGAGAGAKASLATPEQKLFFILRYLRQYPVQELMGFYFDFTQEQANKWIGRLRPRLQRTLEGAAARPSRRTEDLNQVLARCRREILILDGTDRPIGRPQEAQAQEACDNGRKKRHPRKHVILIRGRVVEYVSPTAPGAQADKTVAQPLEAVWIPQGNLVISDLGFQGLKLKEAGLMPPAKKPKGRALEPYLKTYNRLVARARVGVEHVLSGVKRCRIVSDPFRNLRRGRVDLVMAVACGLHNFRERHRRGRGSSSGRHAFKLIRFNQA